MFRGGSMNKENSVTCYFEILDIKSKISACSSSGYGLMSLLIGLFLVARVGYFLIGYVAAATI
jgi:hypothetical protein